MNDSSQQAVAEIVEAIHRYDRFLVATHVRPDGDALGSLLGLTAILKRLGKMVYAYSQDAPPPHFDFLSGFHAIQNQVPAGLDYEAAILVDCGDLDRVGPAMAEKASTIPCLINIDHHVSNQPFGTLRWVEPTASSTCEMLYDLCTRLPVALDAEIASSLYVGMLTDTGSFRFSNTTHRVLEIAARLVAAGAQPDRIAERVYDSASPQRLRLLAEVLSSVAFYGDNRLATAVLTQKMFNETSTSPGESDGFINHLRSVKTVELAILFREDKDGLIYVSMRSKGIDVAAFAQRHGGGGHHRAAAFRVDGALDDVRDQYTREALRYLQSSRANG